MEDYERRTHAWVQQQCQELYGKYPWLVNFTGSKGVLANVDRLDDSLYLRLAGHSKQTRVAYKTRGASPLRSHSEWSSEFAYYYLWSQSIWILNAQGEILKRVDPPGWQLWTTSRPLEQTLWSLGKRRSEVAYVLEVIDGHFSSHFILHKPPKGTTIAQHFEQYFLLRRGEYQNEAWAEVLDSVRHRDGYLYSLYSGSK